MDKKTLSKVSFGLVLLLGIGLRLININQSFWLDEASQAQQSSMTVGEIWHERPGDFHPPLFYLLSHFWLQFGKSESWLRLLPIGFGVVSIYAIYVLVNKLLADRNAGLIGAFLLAVNPYHIYYSQEFRMYSLLGLLGIWSMYMLLRRSRWLFVANGLMMLTHYSGILLIFSQLLYVLSFSRKDLKWYVTQFFISLIIFLPWLPQFAKQLQTGSNIDAFLPGWRDVLSISATKSLPLVIFKFVAGRINILPRGAYMIYIVFVLGITVIASALARKRRDFVFSWLMIPIITSIFLSYLIPQTQPFRMIYTLPALIIIFTQAVIKFPKLFLTLLIYIAVVGNLLYFTRVRLQREQWRQAISFLSQQQGPILVKFADKFAPFYWYNDKLPVYSAMGSYPAQSQDVAARLAVLTSSGQDIFLLEYLTGLTDPSRITDQAIIELGFRRIEAYNFEGVGIIHQYTKK
jgi:mannosyltransferase